MGLNNLILTCEKNNEELKKDINYYKKQNSRLKRENQQLKEEYDKALELLCKYDTPCELDNFMDRNTEYCSINCGVDEELFKKCWKRYIKQIKGVNK